MCIMDVIKSVTVTVKHLFIINKMTATPEFYTKLNVWGSLGLYFDYDGSPIIENGGPIFLYVKQVSQNIRSFSYLNHL